MNNKFYDRLYSLIEKLRPDIKNEKSLISLIYACSCTMETIKEYFDRIKNEQYLDTMSEDMLDKYCMLLGVYCFLTEDTKRRRVREKLSESYDEFSCESFMSYYRGLGKGFYPVADNFVMTLYGISSSNITLLHDVMREIEYYLPPFVTLKLTGTGITFEKWDSMDMSFEALDALGAPFSVFETMKV